MFECTRTGVMCHHSLDACAGKPGPPPDGTVVINLIRSQFREALHTELGMFIPREYERHLWER